MRRLAQFPSFLCAQKFLLHLFSPSRLHLLRLSSPSRRVSSVHSACHTADLKGSSVDRSQCVEQSGGLQRKEVLGVSCGGFYYKRGITLQILYVIIWEMFMAYASEIMLIFSSTLGVCSAGWRGVLGSEGTLQGLADAL